jgi:hypothetical protein
VQARIPKTTTFWQADENVLLIHYTTQGAMLPAGPLIQTVQALTTPNVH